MIYVVVGPTASGKTDVANKIAEYFDCPIINADAFQIYKDMNIGTNKILTTDPNYHRYHLLDIIAPDKSYSVKEYQDDFRRTFSELHKDNKNIVVVGGTGLYIRAALYDYNFIDEENEENTYENLSNNELYEKLQSLDAEACDKIHVNNRKRLVRALNIIENSGMTKSEIINNQEHKIIIGDDVKFIFINPNRNELYEHINSRVDTMINDGLVDEVKYLKNKYNLSSTATQGIGYKEIIDYIDNKVDLNTAIELIKKRTRNYAKRQVTFFKHQFVCDEYSCKDAIFKEIFKNG